MGHNMLEMLHKNGSHIDDYEYLAMYSDYLRMKAEGEKVAYIVAVLKEKYHVCERKIYKVVKMMGREVMWEDYRQRTTDNG